MMWDQRYRDSEYAYGTQVNDFLKDNYSVIPKGRVLSLGEGEGRNAVFLAKAGYSVTAIDSSLVGLNKAKDLAKLNNVSIDTIHADLANYDLGENQWDGIISIFCPLPSSIRQSVYSKLNRALKKEGCFLVEAYTPRQVQLNTGGGKCVDVLQTKLSLMREITQPPLVYLQELQREVNEGKYHTGLGYVVQAIATKVC